MAERSQVSSGSPWEEAVGYSRAVRVGNQIEVAGTTATAGGQVVGEGDAYAQTLRALSIIGEALSQLGADKSHVVRTRFFVTDIARWPEIGRAHREFFGATRPVTTMVQVSALIDARLLVEIEATAIA
jgi:enamine deaminase RidA (YjgF/YER057c/UK114 family)